MTRSIHSIALAALALAIAGSTAAAQKEKKNDYPKPMAQEQKAQDRAMKDAERQQRELAKDQRKAAERVEHEQHDAMKDQAKMAHRADRRANREVHRAYGMAVSQQAHLAKGLKLSSDQRAQWKAIDRKYDAQYRDLRKEIRTAEKGTAGSYDDAVYLQRISALRDQERAELRAILTPEQQASFDRHATRTAMKH